MTNNEEWIISIEEEKEEVRTEETAEVIRWSRTKKLCVAIISLVICVIIGTVGYRFVFHKTNEDNSDINMKMKMEHMLDLGNYSLVSSEMINNSELSREQVRENESFIEEYFAGLCEEYNNNYSREKEKKIRYFMEVFDEEMNLDTNDFFSLYQSKEFFNRGVEAYEKGNYYDAYTEFKYVLEQDTNYEKSMEYIDKIISMDNIDEEWVIWYTSDLYKDVIQIFEEEYYNADFNDPYLQKKNVSFINEYVSPDELHSRLKDETPDIILCDSAAEEFEDYYQQIYAWAVDLVCYNSEILNEDTTLLNQVFEDRYDGISDDKRLYMDLEDYHYFSMFPMGARTEFGSNEYGIHEGFALEEVIDSLEFIRKNKDKIYTGSDGIELFKNGKIPVAVINSKDFISLKNQMGNCLQIFKNMKYEQGSIYMVNGSTYPYCMYVSSDTTQQMLEGIFFGLCEKEDFGNRLWSECSLYVSNGYYKDDIQRVINYVMQKSCDEAWGYSMSSKDIEYIEKIKDFVLHKAQSRDDIVKEIAKETEEEVIYIE